MVSVQLINQVDEVLNFVLVLDLLIVGLRQNSAHRLVDFICQTAALCRRRPVPLRESVIVAA